MMSKRRVLPTMAALFFGSTIPGATIPVMSSAFAAGAAEQRAVSARMGEPSGMALPRTGSETVDVARAFDVIQTRLSQGSVAVEFRDSTLTRSEINRLFLSLDRAQNLFPRVAELLPDDGVGRSVRFRSAVDARAQRREDGVLTLQIDNVNLADISEAQRDQLARRFYSFGFDRVLIRGSDFFGKPVRVEFDKDRGMVKNGIEGETRQRTLSSGTDDEQRAARFSRADRPNPEVVLRPETTERAGAVERPQAAARPDVIQKPEVVQKPETIQRPEVIQRPEKVHKPEKVQKPEVVQRIEKVELPARVEKVERPEKVEKIERVEKVEKIEVPTRPEKIERPEKVEKVEKIEVPKIRLDK